jgi:DcuC family C4-dicarboxylate transporter
MGFAFLLRITGCDHAMVHYIISPLKKISWFLLPGSCLVGFLTNIAIPSQTAAAAAVGPILIPILTGAGFHPLIAGAALVLGASGGGDLFNPGEPEVVSIQVGTGAPLNQVMSSLAQYEILAFSIAVAIFVLISYLRPPKQDLTYTEEVNDEFKPTILRAIMPPLPILTLLFVRPGNPLFAPLLEFYPQGPPVAHVMVFYAFLLILFNFKKITQLTNEFFSGLGYGYANVISLIITANCFIAGLEAVGFMQSIITFIINSGPYAHVLGSLSVWGMAVISGSGTAPSVAFSNGVLPTMSAIDINHAVDLGAISALGSAFGRTMSPAAAVMIFASALIGVSPLAIVKRTAIPIIAGLIITILISIIF